MISLLIAAFPLVCLVNRPPGAPAWLADLPGVRKSLFDVVVVNAADSGHAPLRSHPATLVFDSLRNRPGFTQVTVGRGLLIGHPTRRGGSALVLSKSSTAYASNAVQSMTAIENMSEGGAKRLASAWRDPRCPVMNFIPAGSADYCGALLEAIAAGTEPPRIAGESMTVLGHSPSPGPWQMQAIACCAGFREQVFDRLKAEGRLADTIKRLLIEAVEQITGLQPHPGGYLPDISSLPAQVHEQIAAAVAKRANELE